MRLKGQTLQRLFLTNEHTFQTNKKKIEFGYQVSNPELKNIGQCNFFADPYQSDDTEASLQMAEECSLQRHVTFAPIVVH